MTYDYECRRCHYRFEDFRRVGDRYTSTCPRCGKTAYMTFSPPRAVHIFQPYWDEHIGKDGPVYLESRRQKRRMLKEQGLEQL
jgi:putative FmdB family regulatory protein